MSGSDSKRGGMGPVTANDATALDVNSGGLRSSFRWSPGCSTP
ncbi:hypothetical protein ACIP79_05245 [Streptomyces sp. NPDC088747]